MGRVTYRHATRNDASALEAFRETVPGAELYGGGAQGWHLLDEDPPSWLAEDGGKVVGYLICHRLDGDDPGTTRIYCLVVHPAKMASVGVEMIDAMIGSSMEVGDRIVSIIDQRAPCHALRGKWVDDGCAVADRKAKDQAALADIVWTKQEGWKPGVGNPRG